MRNERVIANEIEVKRAHLERDLTHLRMLVDEKLELVKRARTTLEHRRDQAIDARNAARHQIADHPLLAAGAAVAAGVALALFRRR